MSRPRRMPRKRIAKARIAAKSEDAALSASTFAAWELVNKPRGLTHNAAATIGEAKYPVVATATSDTSARAASVMTSTAAEAAERPALRH